ncbi:MAG: rhodanese-like domain-containing protein [Polyangiaceae bacterium]|nr:rhodanese-like domain-containing protein [Polyangiaceae bacterium]
MWPFLSRVEHDARERVAKGALLLDVRTHEEFTASHIPGAKNIPVQELAARMDELKKYKSVVVYCRSGARSAAATGLLKRAGHEVLDIGAMGNW